MKQGMSLRNKLCGGFGRSSSIYLIRLWALPVASFNMEPYGFQRTSALRLAQDLASSLSIMQAMT